MCFIPPCLVNASVFEVSSYTRFKRLSVKIFSPHAHTEILKHHYDIMRVTLSDLGYLSDRGTYPHM